MEGYTNMSNIQLDKKSQELLTEGNRQVGECGNTEPEHRGTGDAGEGTKRGLRRWPCKYHFPKVSAIMQPESGALITFGTG